MGSAVSTRAFDVAAGGQVDLAVDLSGSSYAQAIVELQVFTSAVQTRAWDGAASAVWVPDAAEGKVPVAARPRPAGPVAHGTGAEVVLLHREPAVVGEVTRCSVTVPAGVGWVVLRVADHRRGYGGPAPRNHPCASWALAYASPWFLGRDR